MIDYILLLSILASFFVVLYILPLWIKKAKQTGLVWEDMNKISSPQVAGSGGIGVVLGFVIGVLIFVAYRVFYLKSLDFLVEIFSLLSCVLLLSGIGLIDDLFGWRKGGLSIGSRLILVLFASIPLIVINAGKSVMSLPFLGTIDFGLVYPLVLIPIGIVGATTTFNFLAGYNGLEAGQGIILLSSLALVSFFTGNPWLSIILLCMVAALFAFLLFNFYPAQVFPGDSLTYAVGGMVAISAILGNFEKIAVFFFIPYIIETVLKLRGNLKKHSFGKPSSDGSLDLKYNKIYGLEHASIWFLKKLNIKSTEKRVTYSIWLLQILIIAISLVIFRQGIF